MPPSITDLVGDMQTDAEPSEMDTAEQLRAYGATERLRGHLDMIQLAIDATEEETPDPSLWSRLRDALAVLRGRNPRSGETAGVLRELEQINRESADVVETRADALYRHLTDRIDASEGWAFPEEHTNE